MSGPRHTGLTWRHPAFVPAGALIASLLLALVVGEFGGGSINSAATAATSAPTPTPTPTQAATSVSPTPAPVAPTFTAAPGGKARFTVEADITDPQNPLPGYRWKVLTPDADAPGGFKPVKQLADAKLNVATTLGEALVDRLLCVTVPQGWSVSVAASVPNLVPQGEDPKLTACQGGWSDPRAVPSELTFAASRTQ